MIIDGSSSNNFFFLNPKYCFRSSCFPSINFFNSSFFSFIYVDSSYVVMYEKVYSCRQLWYILIIIIHLSRLPKSFLLHTRVILFYFFIVHSSWSVTIYWHDFHKKHMKNFSSVLFRGKCIDHLACGTGFVYLNLFLPLKTNSSIFVWIDLFLKYLVFFPEINHFLQIRGELNLYTRK